MSTLEWIHSEFINDPRRVFEQLLDRHIHVSCRGDLTVSAVLLDISDELPRTELDDMCVAWLRRHFEQPLAKISEYGGDHRKYKWVLWDVLAIITCMGMRKSLTFVLSRFKDPCFDMPPSTWMERRYQSELEELEVEMPVTRTGPCFGGTY